VVGVPIIPPIKLVEFQEVELPGHKFKQ